MKFQLALARYVLGTLPESALPDACTDALLEGYDSPALAALAGEPSGDLADVLTIRPLFSRACRELKLALPSYDQALECVLCSLLSDVVDRKSEPLPVLEQVLKEVYYPSVGREGRTDRIFAGDSLGLERLIGLYWAWRDADEVHGLTPQAEAELREQIVEAAATRVRDGHA